MPEEQLQSAADLPGGEYAIVELFGHATLIGRIAEVERFGSKMLAIEPLFNRVLLPVVFHGGAAIYRLTPCSSIVAWERQPTHSYELPPTIFATIPPAALPPVEPAPHWNEEDEDEKELF